MCKNIIKIILVLIMSFIVIDAVPVRAENAIDKMKEMIMNANNKVKETDEYKKAKEEQEKAKEEEARLTRDKEDFTCQNSHIRNAVQIISTSLLWLRILIPVFLVIKSMINLGKVAISQNDDDIKGAVTDVLRKVAVGAAIFFIPLLMIEILKGISSYGTLMADWKECIQLLR